MTEGMGFGLAVHTSNPSLAMSALGQKQTLRRGMIAYAWDVRALDPADFLVFRPTADIQAVIGYDYVGLGRCSTRGASP
jgi:hypothetical protein